MIRTHEMQHSWTITNSRKGSASLKSSVLKQIRPAVEQEAHFVVMRWICTLFGLTSILAAQSSTCWRIRCLIFFPCVLTIAAAP